MGASCNSGNYRWVSNPANSLFEGSDNYSCSLLAFCKPRQRVLKPFDQILFQHRA